MKFNVLPKNSKVLVIGGGISGLSYSYYLAKLRPDVGITLLEASKRCGGYINSSVYKNNSRQNIVLEKGPRTLRGVSDGTLLIVDTLRQLGNQDIVQYIDKESDANKKYLLAANNQLLQVPNSLSTFFKFLKNPLSKGFLTGILGEYLRPSRKDISDESAFEFFSRRFGNKHVPGNILSAIYHGIYADDIKKLSAQRVARVMYDMEREHGSLIKAVFRKNKTEGLHPDLVNYMKAFNLDENDLMALSKKLKKVPIIGLKGGLQLFPSILRNALQQLPNVQIHINKRVSRLLYSEGKFEYTTVDGIKESDFDFTRFNINPSEMSEIVADPSISKGLELVKSNTIILVNIYIPNKDIIKPYHGFGYLVPLTTPNPDMLLGVIFDSVIEHNFKPLFSIGNAPDNNNIISNTKLTAMVGGHHLSDSDLPGMSNSTFITNKLKQLLSSHLNVHESTFNDAYWEVTVVDNCLPKFHVGYNTWLNNTSSSIKQLYEDRVSLGGMAFSAGPGVPDVVMNAFTEALHISKQSTQLKIES
ncbi:HFR077Wp [Eremothecium sinecaudum]|uniref:Protoporphyrinogen oxidase n=1 Tax=Eremothecium sinecaudum TaxID=45286 RepID=A0A109UZW3_9SACH|nr:HFR077Wp [Eremothecium sinecaudum]AMD21932.1 HFR077Wp [Eremothecium sinecaudum]